LYFEANVKRSILVSVLLLSFFKKITVVVSASVTIHTAWA